ncbi:colicin V production protein [compost metagenome]
MTGIDIVLGGLLLYGLVKGLWKGLFSELASLVSLLVGIYVAVKFSGFVGKMLEGHVNNPKYISITAFAITFIAVVIGIILLAKVFTKLADFSGLGLINRIMGGFFGFLKMVLILSVSLNFFLKINSNNLFAEKETLDNSLFFNPILKVSNTIFPVLEEWFKEYKK